MARYVTWSEERITQFENEGRGKGSGPTYVPWVQVSDFSSLGNSRRVFSPMTNRVHHLMSDVEWQLFLLLEYSRDIIDIREQYPIKRLQTQGIAAELGIPHPNYPSTQVPCVMTCDFLVVRLANGTKRLEMYDCKRTDDAEDIRSIEKLEITRAYADGCGIPHHLIFSSMLPKAKVRNLEWIRSANVTPEEHDEYQAYYDQHQERILYDLANHKRMGSLAQYCEQYDSRTGAAPGTGLRVARQLILNHRLVTDLNQPDLCAAPISMFQPHTSGGLRLVSGA